MFLRGAYFSFLYKISLLFYVNYVNYSLRPLILGVSGLRTFKFPRKPNVNLRKPLNVEICSPRIIFWR